MAAARDTAQKRERLEARLSREQKLLLQRAAELKGLALSDFVITSAAQAAMELVEAHSRITLTERESMAFAEALLRADPAGPNLKKAAMRYRAVLG